MKDVNSRLEIILSAYNSHRKVVDYSAHIDQVTKTQTNCQECKRVSGEVMKMYADNELTNPLDAFHAAIILHHGIENEYAVAANDLCKYAVARLGDNHKDIRSARWLYAASYDRILVHDGKLQKFGTQFVKNKDGKFELATPIDSATTDEERAWYGIPAIEETLKRLSESYS